jgi:hypothetical protein
MIPINVIGWAVDINDVSIETIGLVTAIPYIFQFMALTYLIATWSSVFSIATTPSPAADNAGAIPPTSSWSLWTLLRIPLFLANVAIIFLVVVVFSGSYGSQDKQRDVLIYGTIIIFGITMVITLAFMITARLIMFLTKSPLVHLQHQHALELGAADGAPPQPVGYHPSIIRMFWIVTAYGVCLCCESLVWCISLNELDSLRDNGRGTYGTFYVFTLISIIILLLVYRQDVDKQGRQRGPTRQASSISLHMSRMLSHELSGVEVRGSGHYGGGNGYGSTSSAPSSPRSHINPRDEREPSRIGGAMEMTLLSPPPNFEPSQIRHDHVSPVPSTPTASSRHAAQPGAPLSPIPIQFEGKMREREHKEGLHAHNIDNKNNNSRTGNNGVPNDESVALEMQPIPTSSAATLLAGNTNDTDDLTPI